MIRLSDTFTDANDTVLENHLLDIGSRWGPFKFSGFALPEVPSWKIESNTVVPGDLPIGPSIVRGYQADAGIADATISFNYAIGNIADTQAVMMILRYTDQNNFLLVEIDANGTVSLATFIGGGSSVITSVSVSPDTATHLLQVGCNGPNITISIDGSLLISQPVTFNATASHFGMAGYNNGNNPRAFIDNFLLKDPSAAPLPPGPSAAQNSPMSSPSFVDTSPAITSIGNSINQVAARIAEVTASLNPSYSVGGRTVSKTEYLAQLTVSMDQLIMLQQKLAGPYEVRSRGVL